MEMPRYRSHKVVHALKILGIENPPPPTKVLANGLRVREGDQGRSGEPTLVVEAPYAPIRPGEHYFAKHRPQVGGYYVLYPDGYESWSPAGAFEAGYAPEPRDPVPLKVTLTKALNRHCAEAGSNTPDFILAGYLLACLEAFDAAVRARESWYGIRSVPGQGTVDARPTHGGGG